MNHELRNVFTCTMNLRNENITIKIINITNFGKFITNFYLFIKNNYNFLLNILDLLTDYYKIMEKKKDKKNRFNSVIIFTIEFPYILNSDFF